MKIKCDAKRLDYACGVAKQVIAKRSMLPVTQFALVTAKHGKVTICATDLETLVSVNLDAEVEESGTCLINPTRCQEFIKGEKGKIMVSDLDKLTTEVRSESGGAIKMAVTDGVADMKQLSTKIGGFASTVKLPDGLGESIKTALHCVATEDSRPVLAGASFKFTEEKLILASADGFRLITVEVDHKSKETQEFIIPAKPLRLVSQYIKGNLRFACDDGHVWFIGDGITIASQRIQGTY
ncbi:hypothetical protein LCGC14_2851180, partial [marine sediment metagenome]